MRSIVLIGLAVLIGTAAFGAAWTAQGGGIAVRVAAERLDDGRFEIGVQQRAEGDSWGEISWPANRFPAPDAATGETRYISPTSMDVRIAAQRMEDGSVRFGLRVRDGSGGWLEPVTARLHRFDPANTSTGRWLVSSRLTLEIDDAGSARMVRSDQIKASPGGDVELVSGQDGWSGDSHYSAYHDEGGDLVTIVSTYSVSVGTPDGELMTTITCQNGEISLRFGNLPSDLGNGAATQQVPATWSVDNGTSRSESLRVTTTATALELEPIAGSRLADALLGHGSQLALAIGATPELLSNINLDELRTLPVYSNLRHCAGEVVQSGRTELRIRAQLRADERIEFALQQRTADGWSDHILPKARTIAAFGGATNWLSSTLVSVRVELEPPLEIVLPDLAVRQAPEPITPVFREGFYTDQLTYLVYARDLEGYAPTKLTSVVGPLAVQGLQLQIGCFGDKRQVRLVGPAFDATGDLMLAFDDTQLIAKWNVSLRDGFTSLAPTDSDRFIQRLRQAQSFSVRVGDGGANPISFDLTDLFETPIQPNIDQCGNYAEPEWQPFTASLFVQDDLGLVYAVAYPDWSGKQRISQVRVAAIDGTTSPAAEHIGLVMTCRSPELRFQIWGLSEVGQPPTIGLRVGDGEWYSEPVSLHAASDGSLTADLVTGLNRLKQGAILQFELGLEQPVRGSFDLTNLLGTPIQANFDNCGRDYWAVARTYVPVVGQSERVSRYVSYITSRNEDDTVTTKVSATAVDADDVEGEATIDAYCLSGSHLQVQVDVPIAMDAGEVAVTLNIDDRPAVTSTWTVLGTGSGSSLHPPSNAQLMAQLRDATVVLIHAPDLIPLPITVHLAGMFNTPVQRNLDECGYYRPGEIRMLPLSLNAYDIQVVYDPGRDLRIAKFWQREPGKAMPDVSAAEHHLRNGILDIGLSVSCGNQGASLTFYGSIVRSLLGDDVLVEWSVDGSAAQRETWKLTDSGVTEVVSPTRARALIASWRDASDLEIKLLDASPIAHLFNLKALFEMPVIDTLDACLAAPLPSQSTPVSGIPLTARGELTLEADFFGGSSWLSSSVSVKDTGAAPVEPDALDERSALTVGCGVGGIEAQVLQLDAAESAFIAGDTVEVDWQIDGRSRSETGVAWTQYFLYAIAPPDHSAFYEALNIARTLTIHVQSDPPITKTYELARHGFWDTPVQPNLDACGAP